LKQRLNNPKSPITNNHLELKLLARGFSTVVGIDEAGRGAWAGPVSIGYYAVDQTTYYLPGITDSKKLSIKKRDEFFQQLFPATSQVLFVSPDKIDQLGISRVIELAILEIMQRFDNEKTFFIIDGQFSRNLGCNTMKIIQGDVKHYAIAAASIIAKVSRDVLMKKLAQDYPGYGLENHVGYGTKAHQLALESLGVLSIHRKSYRPIQLLLNQYQLPRQQTN